MHTLIRVVNGTARFLWWRAMRNREALGVALGCGISFSLYALAQLWPVLPASMIGLFVGPFVTALVAQRYVLLLGALTNSLFLLFGLFFRVFMGASFSDVWAGLSGVMASQGWFYYLAALTGVQAISLIPTLPIVLFRSSRSRLKPSRSSLKTSS